MNYIINNVTNEYELERVLTFAQAERFELLSTWRLAQDDSYVKWAATLGPKAMKGGQ